MLVRARDYLTVASLRSIEQELRSSFSDRQRRALISIGVIDDQPFAPRQSLENLGYRITTLNDPYDLAIVQPYQIVLCDLQGVGMNLDTAQQGAFIIDEIKKNFPEKIVVAYTGGASNLGLTRQAQERSDLYLRKDAIIEEWRDLLDGAIDNLINPRLLWMRLRAEMIARGSDTYDILKLEDAYVYSILHKGDSGKGTLQKIVSTKAVGKEVRAIASSLVSSAIYSLITGT